METPDTIFSIPTYRLRDVPDTVESYDENFWRNAHEVALFVFDDSSLVNHDKYYSQLAKTRTANPLYYVGPREKERFIQILLKRLREPKLEALVRNFVSPELWREPELYPDVFVRRVSWLPRTTTCVQAR